MRYARTVSKKNTPQSEPIPGKAMVKNSAGGYTFKIDDWARLDRFLILGTEGGTYYVGEREITRDNAAVVERCLKQDGVKTVNRIVEISETGRAPKPGPAIFALCLAISCDNLQVRQLAGQVLHRVCRTGTHLFTFLDEVQELRGWGRGLRNAVGRWYNNKPVDKLAYQMGKYQQREGWSNRDALRLSHPKTAEEARQALYRWAVKGEVSDKLPKLILDMEAMKGANEKTVLSIIAGNSSITWEMIPTELLGSKKIWEALLPNLPMTALTRNLARMTSNGLITPMGDAQKQVVTMLSDVEAIKKSRIHPIQALTALITYGRGYGTKGSLTWTPNQKVKEALEGLFYASFGNVESTGKNFLLALDVSGSMGGGVIAGIDGLTPAMATACMAMVTARCEPSSYLVCFSTQVKELGVTSRDTLESAMRKTVQNNFGGTDCAAAFNWAKAQKAKVDCFVVYTDNETWAGKNHPSQALEQYRKSSGIHAKAVAVGMTATENSMLDGDDPACINVVGFDTGTPQMISDFAK